MRYWRHILIIRKKQNRAGFTLVEIIVALTIFSMVALAIGTTFMSGMRIWTRSRSFNIAKTDFLIGLEAYSGELRQALNIPAIGFEGTVKELSFPSLDGASLVRIVYKVESAEEGVELVRRKEPLALKDILGEKEGAVLPEESETATFEPVLERKIALQEASFTYLYLEKSGESFILKEKDAWEKADGVPSVIKLNGIFGNEEFTKTVFIPVSS